MWVLKDDDMNEYVCFCEEDAIVAMSTPDLRMVSELEIADGMRAEGKMLIGEGKVDVIGW